MAAESQRAAIVIIAALYEPMLWVRVAISEAVLSGPAPRHMCQPVAARAPGSGAYSRVAVNFCGRPPVATSFWRMNSIAPPFRMPW